MTGSHESVMSGVGNWDGCTTTQRKKLSKKKKKKPASADSLCRLPWYEKYGRYVWPDATTSPVYDWGNMSHVWVEVLCMCAAAESAAMARIAMVTWWSWSLKGGRPVKPPKERTNGIVSYPWRLWTKLIL